MNSTKFVMTSLVVILFARFIGFVCVVILSADSAFTVCISVRKFDLLVSTSFSYSVSARFRHSGRTVLF